MTVKLKLGGRLRSLARSSLTGLTSLISGRHTVLLPPEAADESKIFRASAPYRLGRELRVNLTDARTGELRIELLAYEGFFPTRLVWNASRIRYEGPAEFRLSLETGRAAIADESLGDVALPIPSRRFALRFTLSRDSAIVASRATGHYQGVDNVKDNGSYYQGDDYVDYESQSIGEHEAVVSLMRENRANGPVLDVGCATGGLVQRLLREGFDAYGIDQSQWAVELAAARVGAEHAFHCNIETDSIPNAITRLAPFGTIVMWAVYEHFRDPPAVLTRVSGLANSGTLLLLNTTNAGSLSRLIFGQDWEGHFDWTHFGAESITLDSLRSALETNGWEVLSLRTHTFWHSGIDPDQAVFRDLHSSDARFRSMLESRNLGDFVVCAARRK